MPILEKEIIFSDEAHFDLGVYINKQNCRICKNPHAYIEKPTHPKRITVWCGFWSRDIIGPFFFDTEQEKAITVNGDRYRPVLNEFLFTKIEEEDIVHIWFEQDGRQQRTAEAPLDILRPAFEDRIINRRADVVWPPRSCDFTPLKHYLCGAVKDKCYADKPETIHALRDNIHEAIGEIQLHTIYKVLKNWTDRVDYYMTSRDSHYNEIIFHYLPEGLYFQIKK